MGSFERSSNRFNPATNQVTTSGFGYDAAGNMTNNGSHSYTYDAEGRVLKVDGGTTASYVYDALDRRVQTVENGTTTVYAYNIAGQRVASFDGSGNPLSNQVYVGGSPVAFYQGGSIHYQHQDWLGTERARTNASGAVEGTYQSLPFGDGFSSSGTDNDAYHFALLDRDADDTHHAQFRQYSSTQGRWMSPDPYDGSYDGTDPQSFNRYAYVGNRPLSDLDPLGMGDMDRCSDPWYAESHSECPYPSFFEDSWDDSGTGGGGSSGGSSGGSGKGGAWNDTYTVPYPGLLGAIGQALNIPPLGGGCEFGACGGGGFGFQGGQPSPVTRGVNLLNDGLFTYVGLLEELGSLRNPYRLFGTRWCGPGGGGGTTSNVDSACRAHDLCYADHGLSFLPNLGIGSFDVAQTQAARGCNQALYNAVKAYPNEHGSQAIQLWLTHGVSVGILAPGTSVIP